MSWRFDPVAAATHPDPYPCYASLARARGFGWDDGLGMWVAASAEAVREVLTSGLCRVRPAGEPVPSALAGATAGEVFGRLVRMTDGEAHAPLRRAVSAALATVDLDEVASLAAVWAATLWGRDPHVPTSARVTALAFDLSAHVVGDLLGLPRHRLGDVAGWTGGFVRCLAPASTAEQVADGIGAAERLAALVTASVRPPVGPVPDGLLAALLRETRQEGIIDETVVVANAVGFLSQAYEATAGLIGNALLALAADPGLRDTIAGDPSRPRRVVHDVLRADPPIQSTRRVVEGDGTIAGREVREGDAVLVLLAAANHDPATSPRSAACRQTPPTTRGHGRDEPHSQGPQRSVGRDVGFSLGAGVHVCPGSAVAVEIAVAAVQQVLAAAVSLPELAASFVYRPSANARVPVFVEREGAV